MSDDETIRMSGDVTPSPLIDHGRFVPGSLVGSRYRIVALLGKGGMGEVYRADDLLLAQSVALKFLPRQIAGNPDALARLLGEVRIARQISHPNVCRVYDIGEVSGEHFISMEYVQGEDLRSLLHRIGRFGPEKGLQIARQICAGLAAAHDRGVLHRDLKPANVMIDERGVARITDFGLAVLADSSDAQRREGTPAYMAPEQLAGQEVTTRSDLYSLGLVLYEIFTGRTLFEAKTITELLEQRRSTMATSVRLTSDVDPLIERAIQKCLSNDPLQRPRSAAAVAAALPGGDPLAEAIAAGETPSPDVIAAAGERDGVRPALAVAGLASVFALLALVVVCKLRIDVVSLAGIHDPPDAMAARARDLLSRVGYSQRPAGRAWSYQADRDRRTEYFWYRESPRAIVPTAFFRTDVEAVRSGSVMESAPPVDEPGEAIVRLDPDGRLLSLRVVPPQAQSEGPPFDWNVLLDAAQLNRTALTAVPPSVTETPFDRRGAWTLGDQRIEAASLGGRPVYFEIIKPHPPVPRESSGWMVLFWMLFILTLVGILASRNVRMGRADVRGATRTAFVAGGSMFMTWLLGADHVATSAEIGLLIEAIAWFSMMFCALWLGYVALEPTLRRRWPHSMVSWSRVLRGEWRDPQVGRDVLAGVVGGCALTLASLVIPLIGAWLRSKPAVPMIVSEVVPLNGTRQAIGELFSVVPRSIMDSMSLLIAFIFFWIFTKREWAAALLFWLLDTFLFAAPGAIDFERAASIAVFVALVAFLPRRFGYLALAVAFVTDAVVSITPAIFPLGIDVALLGLGAVAALAIYGFVVSLAGRSLFSAELLEA